MSLSLWSIESMITTKVYIEALWKQVKDNCCRSCNMAVSRKLSSFEQADYFRFLVYHYKSCAYQPNDQQQCRCFLSNLGHQRSFPLDLDSRGISATFWSFANPITYEVCVVCLFFSRLIDKQLTATWGKIGTYNFIMWKYTLYAWYNQMLVREFFKKKKYALFQLLLIKRNW